MGHWGGRWAQGASCEPVRSLSCHVFARLCDQVDVEAKHKVKNEKVVIDRTLPPFQALESSGMQQTASHVVSEKPDVLPPSIAGCRKVKVTKAESCNSRSDENFISKKKI